MMPFNETIQFTFKGRDQLSGPTANAQRRIDALGGSFRKSMMVATAFGTVIGQALGGGLLAVGNAFRNGYRDAQTYNQLIRQTGAVLKATGGAAGVSVNHVLKMASSLESLSLVDENLIVNAENVLLTFRRIQNVTGKGNDIFDQATKAALNLSLAMHEDLQTAAVQVGKALNDPVDGMNNLRRIGVTFSRDQQNVIKNLEKTGHHLEAQKMILAELTKEFGGTAEAAGKGLPGALFRLKDALTDAFRDLFRKYEPGLARFATWLAKGVPGALHATISALDAVGQFIVKSVVPELTKLLKEYGPKIAKAFGEARDRAIEVWREYSPKVVKLLGQARDKAVVLWKQYGPKVAKVLDEAKDDIRAAFNKIKGLDWNRILGNAKDIATKVAKIATDVGTEIGKDAKEWGGKILDGINTGLKTGDWKPLGKTVGEGLATALKNSASAASKIAGAVEGWMANVNWYDVGTTAAKFAVPFAVGFVTDFVNNLFDYVFTHPMDTAKLALAIIPAGKFLRAFGPLRRLIEKLPFGKWISDHILAAGAAVFDGIKTFVKGIGEGMWVEFKNEFPRIGGKIEGIFKGGFKGMLERTGTWLNQKAKDLATAIGTGIGKGVNSVIHAVGDVVREINKPFLKPEAWLLEKGIGIMNGLKTGIGKVAGAVAKKVQDIKNAILDKFAKPGVWLLDKGSQFIDGLKKGIDRAKGAALRNLQDFVNNIKGKFTTAKNWLLDRGSQLIDGIRRGWNRGFGAVMGRVTDLKNRITGFFKGAFNWIFNDGWRVVEGFFSGMGAKLRGAYNWVRDNLYEPVKNAIVSLFKIQSPSKVMMGLGAHVIGGFVKGLLLHNPVKTITGVGVSALGALASLVGKGAIAISRIPMNVLGKLSNFLFGGSMPMGGPIGQKLSGSYGPFPAAVARWAPLVMQGLRANGLSPLLLGKVLKQLQTESGGNPFAVNNWDVNARRGTPSKGLMQVIGPTFGRWHYPGTSWDIFDPRANIFAALRYAKARYGPGLSFLGQGHGYDTGGVAAGSGWWFKGPQKERVLSPRQTVAFERFLSRGGLAGRGGGGGDIHIHLNAPNYVGSRQELMDELYRLARQGRLRQVVTMATS